jgi:hypothetical protein
MTNDQAPMTQEMTNDQAPMTNETVKPQTAIGGDLPLGHWSLLFAV